MPRRYSPEELLVNRRRYNQARRGDLTSFAGMLGDSFAMRIEWLTQLIRDAHDQTLGGYKERLLKNVIESFLPKQYEVGTGFVLFPQTTLSGLGDNPTALQERPPHEISRQLDLIVFDSATYPLIFRDGDFVVTRPEAVRCVVEVKGALDQKATDQAIELFLDYGQKWRSCRQFYRAHSMRLPPPSFFLMAWGPSVDRRGYPGTDGKRLRERIVARYRELPKSSLPGLPLLGAAYLYNDCAVSSVVYVDEEIPEPLRFGYMTRRGKLVRYDPTGDPALAGDATVPELLANIQYSLETPFNSPIAHVDQTNSTEVLPHRLEGFESWLEGDDIELTSTAHLEDRIS